MFGIKSIRQVSVVRIEASQTPIVRRHRPAAIDFWADAVSEVVLRAEVEWSKERHMKFELVESATSSDGWYHESAHAPGQEVERLDALSSR